EDPGDRGGREQGHRGEKDRRQARGPPGRAVAEPDRRSHGRVEERRLLLELAPGETGPQEVAALRHLLGDRRLARLVADPERPAAHAERGREEDEPSNAEDVAMPGEPAPHPISLRLLSFETGEVRYRCEKNTAPPVLPID